MAMNWSELEAQLADAVVAVLMDEATYTPAAGGDAAPVRAAVGYRDTETGALRSTVQTVTLRKSTLPGPPRRGDAVTITASAKAYLVDEVATEDGEFIVFAVRSA